jgi:hypothetical protein
MSSRRHRTGIAVKSHAPTSHEIAANADMAKVSRVIDEWLLIEYAVTFLPINQNALVEAIGNSAVKPDALKQLGNPRALRRKASGGTMPRYEKGASCIWTPRSLASP